MKEYSIAIREDWVEVIRVLARDEEQAIDEALKRSSFQQPEFVDVDKVEELV